MCLGGGGWLYTSREWRRQEIASVLLLLLLLCITLQSDCALHEAHFSGGSRGAFVAVVQLGAKARDELLLLAHGAARQRELLCDANLLALHNPNGSCRRLQYSTD